MCRTSWSKERPGSCTATAARPWTCATLGMTATRTCPDSSAVRAAISATRTESGSFGSTTTSDAPHSSMASTSIPVLGRRPGPPGTVTAPACSNSSASPAPAVTATMRRPARVATRLRAVVYLLGEVGDPDPVGAAGLDPGLDRGAHVVDVHVDVPQAAAADHDERVAERGQRLLQVGDPGVLGVEEVHHLVRRAVGGQVVGRERHRDVPGAQDGARRDGTASGEGGLRGVEDHAEAAAAGVDHAGVVQGLELVGRALERRAGGGGTGGDHVTEAVLQVPGGLEAGVAGGAGDGEDGALDRLADRGVAGVGGLLHRLGEDLGGAVGPRRAAEPAGDRTQHLRQDHAGVAAGTEQGSAREGGQRRGELGLGAPAGRLLQRVTGRGDGEEHVGAGVPVGHRVDVERVDLLAGVPEGGGRDVDETEHHAELEHVLPLSPSSPSRADHATLRPRRVRLVSRPRFSCCPRHPILLLGCPGWKRLGPPVVPNIDLPGVHGGCRL